MPSTSYLVLGLLASAAITWADNSPRCGYRLDSCGQQAKACERECSGFLRATVTPCPVRSTVLQTVTNAKAPVTTTIVTSITTTDSFSNLVTSSSTTTIEDTLTQTSTTTDTITTTTTQVATITTQAVSVPLIARRDAESTPFPPAEPEELSEELEARGAPAYPATTCQPKTTRPCKVPASASSVCRNDPARFSSACACAGVTASTTTLRPGTIFVTSTKTVGVAPTATVTSTATTHVSVTKTQTTLELTTLETTVTTSVTTTTEISINTVTEATTTTTTALPSCTAYRFVVQGDVQGFAGQFITGERRNGGSGSLVSLTSNVANAFAFTLRSNGRIYDQVNVRGWASRPNRQDNIMQLTNNDYSYNLATGTGIRYLTCSIQTGTTSVASAVGTLQCGTEGASTFRFGICPRSGSDLYQLGPQVDDTCFPVTFAAIPAALTSC